MEATISAIAGDLVSRLISFLVMKYTEKTGLDEKLERLQKLLLRVHAVVEEADGRYVTNSRMLMQLKLIAENMYRGYHMLDTFRYKSVEDEEVRSLSTISDFAFPLKRSRSTFGTMRDVVVSNGLQSVLDNLEADVANMSEFVVMLGGCERMFRRPYDAYLYTDNFMFSRHVEKQQIINILLQTPAHLGAPMVLPIIGGFSVGKKTLVSHVCNNEQIRSQFPSILYINGDSIRRTEDAKFSNERTLLVVEFVADVDDDDWVKFYSTVTRMAGGSKVIIVSRIEKLARFGTVKVVNLNSLSHEEFSYLFKMLAFGSTDQTDYPQLASIANDLVTILGGSLVPANAIAELLRRNLDVQFWLRILRRFRGLVENHLSKYGQHPKETLEKKQPIDITSLASSYPARLLLMPPRVARDDPTKRKLTSMLLVDLIAGCTAIPNDEFEIVAWESRIPPYTMYVHSVAPCAEEKHGCTTPTRKRRSSV